MQKKIKLLFLLLCIAVSARAQHNLSLNKSGSASNNAANNFYAFDCALATSWGAGDYAPQWISIDLGSVSTVDSIVFVPETTPSGKAAIDVYSSINGSTWTLVDNFNSFLVTLQPYTRYYTLSNIRYLKFETTSSPSWIAWWDISVFGNNTTFYNVPVDTTFIIKTICAGQSYLGYTTAGNYSDIFTSHKGCDSVRILNLIVNNCADTCKTSQISLNTGVDTNGNLLPIGAQDMNWKVTSIFNTLNETGLSIPYNPYVVSPVNSWFTSINSGWINLNNTYNNFGGPIYGQVQYTRHLTTLKDDSFKVKLLFSVDAAIDSFKIDGINYYSAIWNPSGPYYWTNQYTALNDSIIFLSSGCHDVTLYVSDAWLNIQSLNAGGFKFEGYIQSVTGYSSLLKQSCVTNTPPTLTADNTIDYCVSCQYLSPNLSITSGLGCGNLDTVKVYFTTGYTQEQDTLQFVPQLGINSSFNANTGVLTLYGNANYGVWETVLKTVCYKSLVANENNSNALKNIVISLGNALYNPTNGHYYKLVNNPPSKNWTDAKVKSSQSTYFGLQGYLVTITTPQEDNFITTFYNETVWIGASDSAMEGEWRWVTGCEGLEEADNGKLFWLGNSSGNPVGSNYANWLAGNPSNTSNEDVASKLYPYGYSWNDANENTPYAYVIEYGCMPNDPDINVFSNVIVNVVKQTNAGIPASLLSICSAKDSILNLTELLTGEDVTGYWQDNGQLGGNLDTQTGKIDLASIASGNYQIKYIVQGSGACPSDTSTVEISLKPTPQAQAGIDQEIGCKTPEVSIGSILNGIIPGTEIVWTAINGQQIADPGLPTQTINQPGTYIVKVLNLQNGCFDEDTVLITKGSNFIEDVISQAFDAKCFDTNTGSISVDQIVGGNPPFTYYLSGEINESNNSGIFKNLASGNYTIRIEDSEGCLSVRDFVLEPPHQPSLYLKGDTIVYCGDTISLQIQTDISNISIADISWFSGKTLIDTSGTFIKVVSPTSSTSYSVRIKDLNGCEIETRIDIKVDNGVAYFAPNAFTPNYDGINDVFSISFNEEVDRILTFRVFDRWGALMIEQKDMDPKSNSFGWNGSHRSQTMVPGVYVWMAEYKDCKGNIVVINGDVTLIN